MKILHFADLHLGVEAYGHPDPDTGLNSRFLDLLRCLDTVVERALEGDVDLVLFCGDAYKSRRPEPTEQREFAKRMARLASRDIPVFLLTGNHDRPQGIGRAAALEVFPALAIKNITVAHQPGTYLVSTRAGPLQVVALPWARPSATFAQGLTMEDLDQKVAEGMAAVVQQEAARLDPGLPAVLAAHLWVLGSKVGSECGMVVGKEPTLSPSALAHPAFSYVALGHIHRHQVLRQERPIIAYSGSPERLDFSDEDDDKGYYLVEITDGESIPTFHPTPARRFLTLRPKLDPGEPNPTATVLGELARQDIQGAIVRLEITLPRGLAIEEGELRKALREAYYARLSVVPATAEPRVRLPVETRGLAPLEALGLYLDTRKTPPERKGLLLKYARELMEDKPS